MKKKILYFALCVVVIVGFYFAISSIFPSEVKTLEAPMDIHVSGYKLKWTGDNYAVCYELRIGDRVERTFNSEYNLKFSDNGKKVEIISIGDGKWRADSPASQVVTVYFSEDVEDTENFVYYRIDELGIRYQEFNYSEAPISVSPFNTEEFGYAFSYWYRKTDEGEVIEENDFTALGNVYLYAKIQPITYDVSVVSNGFNIENTPSEYTVKTIGSLKRLTAESEGYKISDWQIGENGPLLSETSVVTGNIILYPVVSLITQGLEFVSYDEGYAVSGCEGKYETVHVPKQYNGKPVLRVLENAFSGTGSNVFEAKKIIFYGDVILERKSFTACPFLETVEFKKNATVEQNAFMLGGNISPLTLTIYIYGVPNIETAFFAYYLGVDTGITVRIRADSKYVNSLSNLLGSKALVESL